jgi:hypothetical protein
MTQLERKQAELIEKLFDLKSLYELRTPPELGLILRSQIAELEQSISQLQEGYYSGDKMAKVFEQYTKQEPDKDELREELIDFVMNEVDREFDEEPGMKHTREEAGNWIDEYLKFKKP